MLARSGPLPTRGEWAYEVKWDGFRALVSTEGGLCVRSRRGWNMTELVPKRDELAVERRLERELVRLPTTTHSSVPTSVEAQDRFLDLLTATGCEAAVDANASEPSFLKHSK